MRDGGVGRQRGIAEDVHETEETHKKPDSYQVVKRLIEFGE
jgi:hypothetical protein